MRDYELMAVVKLQEQRDELLKACKALLDELCMPVLPGNGGYTPGSLAAVEKAKTEIALAEESTR